MHIEKINTFSWGRIRQDPDVNSKKKPHSEEEEKEKGKEEEEEEEVATALDAMMFLVSMLIWMHVIILNKD